MVGPVAQGLHDDTSPAAAAFLRGVNARAYFARHLIIILTGIIGALASSGMFLAIETWQNHLAELRFSNLASNHLQTINAGLKDATDLLYSLRAYCESLDHPATRKEYQTFSHSLRDRVPGLRDTGWAPRVTRAGRESFEQEIRASGIPDFQIRERDAEGKLVRANERDEYFPILYSDPDEINRPIMGFDLISEPMRRRAVTLSQVTDRPAATPPVRLMNMQRPNGGLLSFIPVSGKPQAVSDAPPQITGVILGVFETATMIQNILAIKARLFDVNMYVFDPEAAEGSWLIYWHSATDGPVPDKTALLQAPHWQGTLELVDQRWTVIFTQASAPDRMTTDWDAFAVFTGGLAMTGSIVAYLWFSLRRTQELERLTTELRATSEELRLNSKKLDHLARHDALTGLPNRMAFRDDVAMALRRAHRGQGLAFLYLDLDRFKAVNDTLGHQAGDRLLCQVAERLRKTAREVDMITRLGGDEFAIAQWDVEHPHVAAILAERVIEALSHPYEIDGQQAVIGVSIGITLAGPSDVDIDQLLHRADVALYAAKRDGRGTVRFFEPGVADQPV